MNGRARKRLGWTQVHTLVGMLAVLRKSVLGEEDMYLFLVTIILLIISLSITFSYQYLHSNPTPSH